MFGIGGGELALIIIVLLIFVGPDKLPQVAKTVGTGLRDLRRAANLAQSELRQGMEELTREVQGVTRDVQSMVEDAAREPEARRPEPSKANAPPATQEPEVLAEVRRRMAEERVAGESPLPWTLRPEAGAEPAVEAAELPAESNNSRPKPKFRVPTGEPLPGTVARGTAASPQPVPEPAADPATASAPPVATAEPAVAAPEPPASDPVT